MGQKERNVLKYRDKARKKELARMETASQYQRKANYNFSVAESEANIAHGLKYGFM